ncbi:hypothetical protein BDR06DRAFT_965675 [Suillus hirtellus]|nr:hypothetical protein BDR06DRAFT_965675 [Suillus hirtellus]
MAYERAPSNLRFYIQEARLPSVDATLMMLFPADTGQNFVPCVSLGEEDEDKETGERFTVPCPSFYLSVDHDDERRCRNAMSILNQPPCVLSGRDLDLFCKRQSLWKHIEAFAVNVMMSPDLRVILDPVAQASSTAHERLWYKLWDCCNTYTHWVFGVFLNGWTAAFVSPVYSYDSHDPSVLQLLFWPCSAMGLPGDWVVSAVRIKPAYPSRHLTASASDLAVTDKSTFILWDGYD